MSAYYVFAYFISSVPEREKYDIPCEPEEFIASA